MSVLTAITLLLVGLFVFVVAEVAPLQMNRPRRVAAALAILVAGSAGGAVYLWLWAPLTTLDQRIAAATAALTAGVLAIAVVAGIVALQAYRDAIRKPVLRLIVDWMIGNLSTVTVSLTNDGTASAQYAIVWLRFAGGGVSLVNAYGWTLIRSGEVRWEAPAGVVIHPARSVAGIPDVPPYTLPAVTLRTPGRRIVIGHTVAADGFGPVIGAVEGVGRRDDARPR